MRQQVPLAISLSAPFEDCKTIFTKPSCVSFLNYIGALCSEMRSFSVLGFTDLFNLPYDKHDYFISRAVWNERDLNRKRVSADIRQSGKKRFHVILDDSAIRKFTNNPFFVGRGYIGNLGKQDRCLSSVFTCFTDDSGESVIPFEVDPYLSAKKLLGGKQDFEFRSKLDLGLSQINRAFGLAEEVGFEIGYLMWDAWYSSAKMFNVCHKGGAKYFGQVRSNRTLTFENQKISLLRLVTASKQDYLEVEHQGKRYRVRSFVGLLNGVDHPVKVFEVRGKFAGKPELRFYVTDDLALTDEAAVHLLGLRWKIDYLFRETKAYLALDEAKFQKLRCYLRHFYLAFVAWSLVREAIRSKQIHARTVFRAIRSIRKNL